MKKIIILIFLCAVSINCIAQNTAEVLSKDHKIDSAKVLVPDETEKRVNQVITQMLSMYHYKKMPLNDSVSSAIYEQYLNVLDNNKLYFLKSDIDGFEKYRYKFDDFLKTGYLDAAFEIFNLYKKRVGERIKYVNKLLTKEFDFTKDDSITLDRENASWAESEDELNNLFKKEAEGKLKGILKVIDEPLVSTDIKGDSHSAIVDSLLTMVNEDFVKVVAWYDNEYGYACRLIEMAEYIAGKIQ